MRGTMLYGRRDVRFEERPEPTIIDPTVRSLQVLLVCSREMSKSQNDERKHVPEKVSGQNDGEENGSFAVCSSFAHLGPAYKQSGLLS